MTTSILLGLVVALILVIYANQEQNKTYHKLFMESQVTNVKTTGRFYQHLKDIDCGQLSISTKDKAVLQMYLEVYKQNVENYLTTNFVDDKTKIELQKSLNYISCDCINET